jgi:4-hydroxy-4-methyl-2-oxoglutarate aldolase
MTPISTTAFERLRQLDTCTALNAVERFNIRLRNEGFVSKQAQCRFPELPPMLGYAATARIRTYTAPMNGVCYYDRMDWWNYIASLPQPRVMVLQDCDHSPGFAALVGEIHASIAQALNTVGCVTNGAVRDLDAVEAMRFPLFSTYTAISHSYAHIVEFGNPVEIGGLTFRPGDLVHGDRNGVHIIPLEIAADVPDMARGIREQESDLIQFCRSHAFSLAELSERLRVVSQDGIPPVPSLTK